MLDGWTNSITKNHHICFIVKVDETLYYWSSIVVRDKTASSIIDYTIAIVDNVEQSGGKVVSCVADNARNVQLALRQISQEKPRCVNIGCTVHIINLLICDLFENIPVLKLAIAELDSLVVSQVIPRYNVTRWNSRFEAIKECQTKQLGTTDQQAAVTQSFMILEEVSKQLMILQSDSSNATNVRDAFSSIHHDWSTKTMLTSSEKEVILKYCDKRWKMFVKSSLGRLCLYFQPFLGVQETTQDFLKELSIENCSNWAQNILPPARYEDFKAEETAIAYCVILGQPLMPNNYPVHQTLANLIKKFPVSEASVERVFHVIS